MTSSSVSLALSGFEMDPADVSQALGIDCTKSCRKGDPVRLTSRTNLSWELPFPTKRYVANEWILYADLPDDVPAEEHVKALLSRVGTAGDRLLDICRECSEVAICIVMEVHGEDQPQLTFEPDVVQLLAQMNAAVDLNLKVFPGAPQQ